MMPQPDPILSPDEAAKLLKVSYATIYRLISLERIPAFKVGGQWRIRTSSLMERLEKGPLRRARRSRRLRAVR